MADDDTDDDLFDSDIDEHEYEITNTGGRTINWRRIELAKDRMLLKKQLEDIQDWTD